jgi:uncharacterized heparinase superfamily protein
MTDMTEIDASTEARAADPFDPEDAEPVTSPPLREPRWLRSWQTLRHYRAGQIIRRSVAIVRRRLQSGARVDRYQPAGNIRLTSCDSLQRIGRRMIESRRDHPQRIGRIAGIRSGRWTFLGKSLGLGIPLDWRSPAIADAPRLWHFRLQYHEWLLDLACDADTEAETWGHVRRWIEVFADCTEQQAGDAWHPYCISRRIPAWLALWAWAPPPQEWQPVVACSLAAQAAFLAAHPETDLGGNHLLENARALVLAGSACRTETGDRWLDLGQRIVISELDEQILPSGEHFERSPMYHCEMTAALEDVRDATRVLRPEFSARCSAVVERMHQFTSAILHPDGEIPLLGDSVLDEAPLPPDGDCMPPAQGARQTGEYWTFRSGDDFLLFDAGPVGPDHLPAHAHADLLTIEVSFEGLRFIVDSGTHDYEDGALREYCRSTAAHNVLELDGENQCDVWSRFRMGRRGRPSPLECGESNDVAWASAGHDAYRHRGVGRVGRWIGCSAGGDWLIADWASGGGMHTLVNRLHLHPEVEVVPESPTTLLLERNGVRRWLTALGRGQLKLMRGWYCPQFGERSTSPVVEFRSSTALDPVLGWQLKREPASVDPTFSLETDVLSICNWGPEARQPLSFRIRTMRALNEQ